MKFKNILLWSLLVTSNFFRMSGIKGTTIYTLSYLIYFYLIINVFRSINALKSKRMPMSSLALCLVFVPMLSLITHFSEESKDLFYNKGMWFSSLAFLFYFVFHIKQVNENTIIKVLLIFGFTLFFIQLIQQTLPSSAIFGTGSEEGDSVDAMIKGLEKRNGFYRFRLGAYMVTLFCMYYSWTRFLINKSTKRFLIFFCFLFSMFMFLTRQLMLASAIGLFSTFLFAKANISKKIMMFSFSVILLSVVFLNADVIFGDMIEKTQNERTDDNIRMLALEFYWGQIVRSPMAFLLGNGYPSDMKMWNEIFHFFVSDIGIVGQWFLFGVLWVFLYIATLYKVLFKYRNTLPLYIKLFVFGTSVNSIMIFPYFNSNSYILWAAVLYICDLHIQNSNLRSRIV